jgi:hypothetical protein
MLEARRDACFAQEALAQLVAVHLQQLDGNQAIEIGIEREIQDAHPAMAEALADLIAADVARDRSHGDGSRILRTRAGRLKAACILPALIALFAFTLTLGALLLFLAQPIFARLVLPAFGGTPSVWNTCVVFYQATLLAGYLYAHLTTSRLGARRQTLLHLAVLALPWFVLPFAVPDEWSPPASANPVFSLLGLLATGAGLPLFAVSATTPLLQHWLASTRHRAAADPYFLYAASNAGSLVALVAYPAVIEPAIGLSAQSRLWAFAYALFVVAIGACAAVVVLAPASRQLDADGMQKASDAREAPAWRQRLRWALLSLVPSSLMLSVTAHITTDIAAIPLLWVVPLSLYLLTFVLTFARRPPIPHRYAVLALPVVVIPPVFSILADANQPAWIWIPLHLAALGVAAMVCHGELARSRPAPRRLTEFYLWISIGGVIGGLLNALLAPVVFRTTAEYPLALVLTCLLRPALGAEPASGRWRWSDVSWPAGLALCTAGLSFVARAAGVPVGSFGSLLVVFGPPLAVCAAWWPRRIRFALALAALLAAGAAHARSDGRLLLVERDFYGVQRVIVDEDGRYRMLLHGSTIHSVQALDAARRRETLSYFSRTGPVGQVFDALLTPRPNARVAVLGLGAGTLACYGRPGQQWTFFEINPNIERLARDQRYFTFLRDCLPDSHVVLGDARLTLARHTGQRYDAIVFDAFSSDAIPVHLMTREAVDLYLARLAPGGLLAFNVSNRYVDLRPVLAALAHDAGLAGLAREDVDLTPQDWRDGKFPSDWVVLARSADTFGPLSGDARWRRLTASDRAPLWTDEYSNVVATFKWRWRAAT